MFAKLRNKSKQSVILPQRFIHKTKKDGNCVVFVQRHIARLVLDIP